MFLNRLNNKEKEMFLAAAVYVSQANGKVNDEEKEAIIGYCKEMGVTFYDITGLHNYEEVVEFFSKVTKEKKRIVCFELLGLAEVDGEFDEVEESFIEKFSEDIALPSDVYESLKRDIEEYTIIYRIICGHVIG